MANYNGAFLFKPNFRLIQIIFLMLILSNLSDVFSALDEIAAVIAFIIMMIMFFTSKLRREVAIIFFLIVVTFVEGLISNVFSGVDRKAASILIDALITTKPFLIFAVGLQLADSKTLERMKKESAGLIKLFLVVALFCCFLNLFGIINMTQETLNGVRDYTFFFGFPTSFAIVVLSLVGIILSYNISIWKQPFFLLGMLLVISTLKSQSIFFVITFFSLYLLVVLNKKYNKIKFKYFVIMFSLGILSMLPSISNYFITDSYSPRKLLLEAAFKLLIQHFPLGSGYATFGSTMAYKDYSPLYSNSGYYLLYGMAPNESMNFLSDNFISSVIGQLGFIGLIIWIGICLYILKLIVKYTTNTVKKIYSIAIFVSLISISVASSFLTSSTGALMMLVLAILIRSDYQDRRTK